MLATISFQPLKYDIISVNKSASKCFQHIRSLTSSLIAVGNRFMAIISDVREIVLTRGLSAIVDARDYEWLSQWNWHATGNKKGILYAARNVYHTRSTVRMHREIVKLHGFEIHDLQVDHINRNPIDNRLANLRIATNAENSRNQKRRGCNKSGYKGVSWSNQNKGWIAQITHDGENHYLGCYRTAYEAAIVYDRAAIEKHKAFANINFPSGSEVYETASQSNIVDPPGSTKSNRVRLSINNTSDYQGITQYPNGKWRSVIHFKGKNIHLGVFFSKEDAARAYDRKALELHGENARLNFPEELDSWPL